jgi:HAD superfamily phosphatase (TIGR01668 family)
MRTRWHADTVAASLQAIDVKELIASGIGGAIIDLDNTIVAYRSLEPLPADAAWVKSAVEAGLQLILVTNNATSWAQTVANNLGIPIIPNARKPLPTSFRRALQILGLPRDRVVVIGDQYFTDVLGAKFAGMAVILIPPISGSDPWRTRPLRIIARLFGFEHRY